MKIDETKVAQTLHRTRKNTLLVSVSMLVILMISAMTRETADTVTILFRWEAPQFVWELANVAVFGHIILSASLTYGHHFPGIGDISKRIRNNVTFQHTWLTTALFWIIASMAISADSFMLLADIATIALGVID